MTFWITLSRGESAANAQVLARTSNLTIVRAVVAGLHENWLLEDDEQDTIADPEFLVGAQAMLADLTDEIRRQASRLWTEEVPEMEDQLEDQDQAQERNKQL